MNFNTYKDPDFYLGLFFCRNNNEKRHKNA